MPQKTDGLLIGMMFYVQMLWIKGQTINVNFGETELMVVQSKGLIIMLPVRICSTHSSWVKVNSAMNQDSVVLFVFLFILNSEILIKLEVSLPSGFIFWRTNKCLQVNKRTVVHSNVNRWKNRERLVEIYKSMQLMSAECAIFSVFTISKNI